MSFTCPLPTTRVLGTYLLDTIFGQCIVGKISGSTRLMDSKTVNTLSISQVATNHCPGLLQINEGLDSFNTNEITSEFSELSDIGMDSINSSDQEIKKVEIKSEGQKIIQAVPNLRSLESGGHPDQIPASTDEDQQRIDSDLLKASVSLRGNPSRSIPKQDTAVKAQQNWLNQFLLTKLNFSRAYMSKLWMV